jgi:hypothetical protein
MALVEEKGDLQDNEQVKGKGKREEWSEGTKGKKAALTYINTKGHCTQRPDLYA